ncbi:hypothetical protein B9Z19DRAFT_1026772 [Tuber borchii]|uniref:Extracellular membrane protein CFEM domain-containing protein n=1 Tax=Tuber borchii TaxID=42251 RepID=A0A2T6ZQ91_TUBBO|nr:hypothetical protein B9Z19DRAFT_1026772 [Tuber borchii]
MHKLSTLLFFSLLSLLTSAQRTLDGDPTGFGCSTCVLLDNPAELVPCSDAWRQLMAVCSTPACASYARYVSKSPPVASCTNTPNPLPGGTASAGISFGTLSGSRGSDTATGGPVFTSASRSMAGPGTTTTRGTGAGGTNSGFVTATGGVGRVVAGGLGFGWLWEAIFMYWGAVW